MNTVRPTSSHRGASLPYEQVALEAFPSPGKESPDDGLEPRHSTSRRNGLPGNMIPFLRRTWVRTRILGVKQYIPLFVIILGGFAVFAYALWRFMRQSSLPQGAQLPTSGPVPIHTGILKGYLHDFDVYSGQLQVEWVVDGCRDPQGAPSCADSDYFINENAWRLLHTNESTPDFSYSADDSGPNPLLDWFEPVMSSDVRKRVLDYGLNWKRSPQSYPLDFYYFRLFYTSRFAQNNVTASVGGVYLYGNVPTFKYTVNSTLYSVDPNTGLLVTPQESLLWMTEFSLERSGSTVTFCFLIILVNWFITVAIAWVTWVMVVGRRKIPKELYGAPLTALFAVPPLRSALPGAPDSAAMIDYVGTIPNVIIIGSCTIIMILASLVRDVEDLYPLRRAPLDLETLNRVPKSDARSD